MAFNARLDIAYSYIDSPPLEATIKAAFVDYLGLYVGDNIAPGFRIIQDVTGAGFPYDTLVYEILENQGSTDGGTSYTLRGKWAIDGDPVDLQNGFTAVVGEADIFGVVDIPEPMSQQMDVVATNRLRNYISRLTKPTLTVSSDNFTGVLDGVNTTFKTEHNFQLGSVKVFYNGMRMKEGGDYSIVGISNIILSFSPNLGDTLIIEYTR